MKVTKFGGSSMADAGQYRKIRDIVLSDPERKVVVVSAAGKRDKHDHKITDLLQGCHQRIHRLALRRLRGQLQFAGHR